MTFSKPSEESGYPIILEDVQDYLATLQPGESCGTTKHAGTCLIARALAWKYGKAFLVDGDFYWEHPNVLASPAVVLDMVGIRLPTQLKLLAGRFDKLALHAGTSITREEAELGIPILRRADNANGVH